MYWRKNKMNQTLITKIEKVINELDTKVEEYATNIMGYPETQYMDILYEDYVTFLESIKNKLEYINEILYTTNEGIQKEDK